jgi:transposase-like protein
MAPEQREVARFMNESKAFLNKEREDFAHLLTEGMELLGVNAEQIARELGCIPATISRWRNKDATPLAGMQHVAIVKLRARAPEYETHYDIVWCKSIEAFNNKSLYKRYQSYSHSHWLIAHATKSWSMCGDFCWQLIDTRNGVVLESGVLSLLFACAREKILDEAANTLSKFEFEVQ